jgi:hypothetical protein
MRETGAKTSCSTFCWCYTFAVNIPFPRIAAALLLLTAPEILAQSPPGELILSEDFEGTKVGEIPQGFTKQGAVAVAEDAVHGGKHSLRIEAAKNGARRITKQGPEIAALGGEHWGRLYFKVNLPVAMPVIPEGKKSGVIHSTLVSGKAMSPLFNDPIEVRTLDTLQGTDGMLRFIYNVQPKQRPEFATSSKGRFRFTDEWTLAEWHVDHATQSYEFFINGEEVTEIALHKGAGQFTGAEIPAAFESLSFGWNNYQPAEPGFVAWIDDIALSKKRIGPTAAGRK